MSLTKRRPWLAIALVAACLAVHAKVLWFGFVRWDDYRFLGANPLFRGSVGRYVWAALTRVQFEAYHPLHLLSYLPDRLLWPDWPAGFHALSLAIFGLNVYLLFRLACRHAHPLSAAGAVLLFAVHPLTVEPVAWITARKDLLAGAFFLGVLLVEDARPTSASAVSRTGLLLTAGAFLAKTSTLCLPLIVWAWLVWLRNVPWRQAARRVAAYAVLAALPAVVVPVVWKRHGMIPPRPIAAPLDVLATLATYLRRLLWPADLAALYPVSMPAPVLGAAAVVALAVAAAVLWRRMPPAARFALFAFPAALLPVLNLVSINLRFADRYAFLALETLVVPAAIALEAAGRAPGRWRAAVAAAVTLATLVAARTTLRLTESWSTSIALWTRAVALYPDVPLSRVNLGRALTDLHDWPGAIHQYQEVVRRLPKNSFGYEGLLFVYATRDEAQGVLPPGTADKWAAELGKAQYRSETVDRLLAEIARSPCRECSDTLLLMRLRRWPKPDPILLQAARAALDDGSRDAAAILLDAVQNKNDPDWKTLWNQAVGGAAAPR